MEANRASLVSSFTIVKGALIEETYAVFRDWDLSKSPEANLEGNRLVTIDVGELFAARVETPEQLDAAIGALRHRIEKLLGEGKKVWIH